MEINSILKPYQRLLKLFNVDKKEISHIYLYSVFIGLTNLSLPLGIQAIINLVQLGTVSATWIVLVVLVIIGIIFSGVLQFVQLRITENLQQKIFVRSSFDFAYRIPRFKTFTMTNTYTPELINRFFDTMTLQKGLPKLLIDFSAAILQLLFGLILLSLYNSFFIVFSLLLLTLLIVVLYNTGKKGVKTAIDESKYKYKVAFWLEELARTMNTFKLVGNSKLPLDRTNELVEGYIKSRESHFKVLLRQFIQLTSFKMLIALLMLIVGGVLVINNQMNIGQFVASEIIILLIMGAVEKLITGLETFYDVLAAIDKIGHVMDIEIESNALKSNHALGNSAFKIDLTNVNFTYHTNNKFKLNDFNLKIESRQHTVLFGDDGSGKTSLLKILGGMYPIQSGSISYNNIPMGDLNSEQLRAEIGDYIAEQQLFSGTIEENITMGREGVTFQDLLKVAEDTKLLEDVKKFQDGFSTVIMPDARSFSRSVTQKIMLARCIINKPKLLLVDDQQRFTSSSLRSVDHLKELLFQENASWTLVAATKNELWLPYFKQIVKLDGGKITFVGTYEEYCKSFK
jgi:ABC-type bacteriocin/lantibiotic exporter with double-glycine peptidase domain